MPVSRPAADEDRQAKAWEHVWDCQVRDVDRLGAYTWAVLRRQWFFTRAERLGLLEDVYQAGLEWIYSILKDLPPDRSLRQRLAARVGGLEHAYKKAWAKLDPTYVKPTRTKAATQVMFEPLPSCDQEGSRWAAPTADEDLRIAVEAALRSPADVNDPTKIGLLGRFSTTLGHPVPSYGLPPQSARDDYRAARSARAEEFNYFTLDREPK